ncbi:hypothetical protein ACGF7W_28735 [Streptomyces sp. NPDC048219]|uniref:hypothetical protein n=1 Tax=unclassified Streptomyces TaxID=2593676 RepID=UPI003442C71D
MISKRRIAAAIGLAAAVTGLVTPMASAADIDVPGGGALDSTLPSIVPGGRGVEAKQSNESHTTRDARPEGGDRMHPVTVLLAPLLGAPAPN